MANLPPLPGLNNLGVIDQFTLNYIHLFAPTKAALTTLSEKVDLLPDLPQSKHGRDLEKFFRFR
jgi:hypothetical protein